VAAHDDHRHVGGSVKIRGIHPRPQMERRRWRSLDGIWQFAFDDDCRHRHPSSVDFDRTISVPYPPESPASGIGDDRFHPAVWYRTVVDLDRAEVDDRLLLHFGAVDYHATVWVNGQLVVEHRGGHTPFRADITEARGGERRIEIVVRAADDPHDLAQPRGKQDWLEHAHEIWYPRTTGIWQTVWLEPVPPTSIDRVSWVPYLDRWEMYVAIELAGPIDPRLTVRVVLEKDGEILADDRYSVRGHETSRRIAFADPGIDDYRNHLLWSPSHPVLIDAWIELLDGDRVVDQVSSYTAMRSVGVQGNRFILNGRPFYLKMVLDQGYWPDTHLAPPSTEALRRDVELAIALGFNGARKHQKLEDPRWLYWCDRLGLLVWAEMPSPYRFTQAAVERVVAEWTEAIRRDMSHPCIVAWVPLNESWGVPDLLTNPAHRDYVRALYFLTKTLDPTRVVVGNDGWEHVATDIVSVHDYASNPAVLLERYQTPDAVSQVLTRLQPGGRQVLLESFHVDEHPVMLSEFGGIALVARDDRGWGYSRADDSDELAARYAGLLGAIHDCRGLTGFCYTQLTDTFQEKNGLLTADRMPKSDVDRIAAATRGKRKSFAMDVDPIV
jgi:beta-galactosidase/beta-glucuronidase